MAPGQHTVITHEQHSYNSRVVIASLAVVSRTIGKLTLHAVVRAGISLDSRPRRSQRRLTYHLNSINDDSEPASDGDPSLNV